MARARRSNDWGFPRWRAYGAGSAAAEVRMCDRAGCSNPGNCPAPKAPNSPERWYFCQNHAAEYNAGWDYFAGLSAEEAAAREQAESHETMGQTGGYSQSSHDRWAGSGDGTRSRDELRALELFDLTPDSDFEAVKKAWRARAKDVHPDLNPGDAKAAEAFRAYQLAYEVLRAAEERREWKG